jgi:hypothetical protein
LIRYDTGKDKKKILRDVYSAIAYSDFFSYCINTLPRKIIKISCKISETDNDDDLTSASASNK